MIRISRAGRLRTARRRRNRQLFRLPHACASRTTARRPRVRSRWRARWRGAGRRSAGRRRARTGRPPPYIARRPIRRASATRAVLLAQDTQPPPRLGPARRPRYRGRPGRDEADRDAGLSDRLGARPLARRFRAAGGAALVRRARGRDQADLRLFLPRHERQSARAYFRARLRQRARHRRLHAGRRTPHHGEGRLARHAGGAGLPARRSGRGLPAVHHRAGARLQPPTTTITSMST